MQADGYSFAMAKADVAEYQEVIDMIAQIEKITAQWTFWSIMRG